MSKALDKAIKAVGKVFAKCHSSVAKDLLSKQLFDIVGHRAKTLTSAEFSLGKRKVRRRHENGNGGFAESRNERFV